MRGLKTIKILCFTKMHSNYNIYGSLGKRRWQAVRSTRDLPALDKRILVTCEDVEVLILFMLAGCFQLINDLLLCINNISKLSFFLFIFSHKIYFCLADDDGYITSKCCISFDVIFLISSSFICLTKFLSVRYVVVADDFFWRC